MGRMDKDLEEARAFALKYCNPDDSDIISDLDRHARETAWALLQRIKHLEDEKCVCEECGCEVEEIEEEYEHTPKEQEEVKVEEEEEEGEKKEVVNESSDPSTLDKLSEISANNKELIKKATKTVAGAGVMVATTQTAAAAATPTLTAATATFFQEAGKKIATIGTAGVMSIGSGAYFQAKTAKAEGIEIAVISEQQYGVFSKANEFTETVLGVTAFESVIKYAEEGYGDVEGTGPIKDEGAEEEGLSEEERSKRAEEASKARIEMDEKGILKIEDDELEKDTPVTPVPKVTDL